jgi:hypothetical protein
LTYFKVKYSILRFAFAEVERSIKIKKINRLAQNDSVYLLVTQASVSGDEPKKKAKFGLLIITNVNFLYYRVFRANFFSATLRSKRKSSAVYAVYPSFGCVIAAAEW